MFDEGFIKLLLPTMYRYKNRSAFFKIFEQIDKDSSKISRHVLMSAIALPIIESKLKEVSLKDPYHFIMNNISKIWRPFFNFPKRMLPKVTSILNHQLVMFKKYPSKSTMFHYYSTQHSLTLLKIRSQIDKSLLQYYDKWKAALLLAEEEALTKKKSRAIVPTTINPETPIS